MRRTQLPPRRTPLKRGQPPVRSARKPRSKRIRTRSRKTAKLYRDHRTPLNRDLETHPQACAVCFRLARYGVDVHCTGQATTWHERRKRGAGGSIILTANRVASCPWGNDAIEDHPIEARAAGLVAREGDADWESLSKRNDR